MPALASATVHGRFDALDGIRGVAITLVVLSHGWTLFPIDHLRSAAPLDGLFHAGNLAVTIFFVVGGFLVTRSLLARSNSTRGLHPFRYYLVRFLRLSVQIYLLLLLIIVVNHFDSSDTFSASTTRRSALAVGTYTWNWYLQNNALDARSDLGHLWYISVQEQYYVGLIVIIALFARHRRRLIWGVAATIVLVTIWRAHSWNVEGWWQSSLRTTTRMDGLLYGTFAALIVERVSRFRHFARQAVTGSLFAVGLLVVSAARFPGSPYYTWQGILINLSLVVFVLGVYYGSADSGPAMRAMTWRPLVRLGTASLAIYVWHFPLFWLIARHTHGWTWFARTVLGLTVLTTLVVLLHKFVDTPTRRWLKRRADGTGHLSQIPVSRPVPEGSVDNDLPAAAADPVDALQDRAHPVIR